MTVKDDRLLKDANIGHSDACQPKSNEVHTGVLVRTYLKFSATKSAIRWPRYEYVKHIRQ